MYKEIFNVSGESFYLSVADRDPFTEVFLYFLALWPLGQNFATYVYCGFQQPANMLKYSIFSFKKS